MVCNHVASCALINFVDPSVYSLKNLVLPVQDEHNSSSNVPGPRQQLSGFMLLILELGFNFPVRSTISLIIKHTTNSEIR